MANEGSYQWWRDNFASDPEFQAACAILQGFGWDCSNVEIDHFPPNASYPGSRFQRLAYAARPAFPLPTYLHRFHRGGGGMGGHASTTGTTFVAKTWTGQLKAQMSAGSFYGAMKQDIIDKRNLALYATEGRNRNLFNNLLVPAVRLAYELQAISETEYYDLLLDLGVFT